jgi:hypothetical protein
MSQELINHNPDLKKLRDEGYAVDVRDGYLLVHEVPYVNSKCQIKYGILVSDLTSMAGDKTTSPIGQHVAHFIGEHPCNSDGTLIKGIQNNSQNQKLAKDLVINHSFSNKPANGYKDYHEKMTTYATIIASQAKAIDDTVTEKPFTKMQDNDQETIFNYIDTNSSRAKITVISSKLENQKIAIIGLGGSGSYILDLIAKTPVQEIHLFDGDIFLQYNAFRSPGAPSVDELRKLYKKTDYFQEIYSKMRKNISSHNYYITSSNIAELSGMDFVFIALDKGNIKKLIVDHLLARNISFIDVGMGVLMVDDFLLGHIRVTTSIADKRDHIKDRISFSEEDAANDYSTNIQIADLNALNAALAVMKWKKLFGFYQDLNKEFNTTYSINDGKLFNEDYIT